jgi:hypothetical protein
MKEHFVPKRPNLRSDRQTLDFETGAYRELVAKKKLLQSDGFGEFDMEIVAADERRYLHIGMTSDDIAEPRM